METADANDAQIHIPVMCSEVKAWLDVRPGQVFVDGTVGYGGHAEMLARELGSEGVLVGLDVDQKALQQTRQRASGWECRTILEHAPYDWAGRVLERYELSGCDRFLVDLGFSSPQVDDPRRGFSFMQDGPLDMRMDPTQGIPANEWLAQTSEKDLRRVLQRYGEEKRAGSIARAIVRRQTQAPLETTSQLAEVVCECFPGQRRVGGVHPATRTFQAIRIVVNRELEHLEELLAELPGWLNHGGRVVFLAYHSLEDRLVKRAFESWAGKTDPVLNRLPVRGEVIGVMTPLTRRAVTPSEVERSSQPRSRSARLRAAERTTVPWQGSRVEFRSQRLD